MTNTELLAKIKVEIERLKDENRKIKCQANERYCSGYNDAFYDLVPFLDTIEEPDRPEPYTGKYDEAYLNEKIKKATESWKGVDVDAMLAECRGYDEEESETTYDTQQYTPRPSVGIEDVVRVQFASHAKVFDKKRKAVFDWEQFKEVAGVFYEFGKKDA